MLGKDGGPLLRDVELVHRTGVREVGLTRPLYCLTRAPSTLDKMRSFDVSPIGVVSRHQRATVPDPSPDLLFFVLDEWRCRVLVGFMRDWFLFNDQADRSEPIAILEVRNQPSRVATFTRLFCRRARCMFSEPRDAQACQGITMSCLGEFEL